MSEISKYTDFFHDGSVIDIQHVGNNIVIFMESAEVDEEDLEKNIIIAKDNRIRGKLHIEKIKSIEINNNSFKEILKKKYDDGSIFNFEITKNSVLLSIDWVNFSPKPSVNEFDVIKIKAEKIWWENIPNLVDNI